MPELDSSIHGAALPEIRREVTWRMTTNYAAAAGEDNPRYFDDSSQGGLVAPPLFAVALTWPMAMAMNEVFSDRIPGEVVSTMVHATERIVFHRLVLPGDEILLRGSVSSVIQTRAGVLFVLRIEALDKKGQPVFTEYNGAMFRGVKLKGESAGEREVIPTVAGEAAEPEWTAAVPTTRATPYLYDGCSDVVFPIHTSPAFARAVGLPDIIVQGTCTLAMCARELVEREAGKDPDRLKEIACRFTGMIIPGTTFQVNLLERRPEKNSTVLCFNAVNASGQTALAGFARVAS